MPFDIIIHMIVQTIAQVWGDIMKKTLSIVIILFMVLSFLPVDQFAVAQTEADSLKMVVHYHRFDGNYDGWNLWIWAKGSDGKSYEFKTEDSYGKKAEIEIEGASSAEEVGFIIRKGEWEAKDVDMDRFVSTAKMNAEGVLEIYLVQGAESVYFSEAEIDLSPKFLKAQFIDEKTLKLVTSKPISSKDLRANFTVVTDTGVAIKPTAISSGVSDVSQNFVVMLESAVTVGKTYLTAYGDYEAVPIEPSGLYDTKAFSDAYTYEGELGAVYTKEATTFRVWAPTATSMKLNLFKAGDGGVAERTVEMNNIGSGVWESVEKGDLNGNYYTYTVNISNSETETYDPYAKAAGVNGNRSMVIDLAGTNPENWAQDKGPVYEHNNDIIVYEMHIRDLSTHDTANIQNVGKFLGVVEQNTKTDNGTATGLSHLKELGITHVQILPMFDFNSIDETKLEDNVFNWGYDPKNYSVPEGSYSTDPYHGEVRVSEMKQMVQGLHKEGIGVIMDVVYNHTALSADSNLNILAPNYYYRMADGKFSNASGTGNETASERAMVRKLMIDSLKYWVSEYHIDGFRFDLMGVHDIETMQMIDTELRKINPNIVLYGEGWTGGNSTLAEGKRLVKANMTAVPTIGAFNDDVRDGIKGHVFNPEEAGFANGALGFEESVKFGIVGAVFHPEVDYKAVNYSKAPWATHPSQSVVYVSAHDNLTLWDKLLVTNPDATDEQRVAMHKLSNAIVLTSQGMPFLHAGVDFLRTKGGDHNSYKSPDTVNWLDWSLKESNSEVFDYYKGLIELRKSYSAFSMTTQEEIEANLTFFSADTASLVQIPEQMIGYHIDAAANSEHGEDLIVLFNGKLEAQTVTLPAGNYTVLVDATSVNAEGIKVIEGGSYEMPASSALILETASKAVVDAGVDSRTDSGNYYILLGFISAAAILVLIWILYRRKQNQSAK